MPNHWLLKSAWSDVNTADTIASKMFHGCERFNDFRVRTQVMGEPWTPLVILKNSVHLNPVWHMGTKLLVNASLARSISAAARVELRKAVVHWYRFPFTPRGGEWERPELTDIPNLHLIETTQIIHMLAEQCREDADHGEYYEVACPIIDRLMPRPSDVREIRVPMPRQRPVTPKYSPSTIDAHGLAWSGVYLMTEPVFDILRPHLIPEYFSWRAMPSPGGPAD